MKIAQIAPLWTRVPPKKYGGTELIVYNLTEELVKRGHQVFLFASGDSKTSAKLISAWPKSLLKEKLNGKPISWGNCVFPLLNVSLAFETISKAGDFDIIHSHENTTCLTNFFTKLTKTPTVITVHNPFPKPVSKDLYSAFKKYKNNNYTALSSSHKKDTILPLNFAGVVYNGIDPNLFRFIKNKENYFAWLGRFSPSKGAHLAIQTAKKTGIKLILAGRIDVNSPESKKYFKQKIKPCLNSKIKYIGEVNHSQKTALLAKARALLNPIQWEEPFGLVMVEAMACGTPVIAFNRGAAPELIKHGKTGFIVENVSQMIKAIDKIDVIKPEDCRKRVQQKFSIKAMVDNYEKLYRKICRQKRN